MSGAPGLPRCDEFVDRNKKISLKISWPEEGAPSMALTVNGIKAFDGIIEGSGGPAAGVESYTADLNADGRADCVIFMGLGGCGLAAQQSRVTFLLSSPAGYTSRGIVSYNVDPNDCVDIKGRAYWLRNSFVFGEAGKDGKVHNYWVYDLLRFSEAELVPDNNGEGALPKWVLYSFDSNHRDTDQLTAEQRMRLWRQQVDPGPR